jgi:hypothetical protein
MTSRPRGTRDVWSLVFISLLVGTGRASSPAQFGRSALQTTASASSSSSRESRSDAGEQTPSGYDHHSSMFAPNGRLLQIEYAMTVGASTGLLV